MTGEFDRELKERERKELTAEPPCRGDDLKQCGDRGLLEWGKPLIERITTITDARRLDHKVAGDRFSGDKLFKALRAANRDASDSFRECCAADAVRYHRELVSRLGGGKHDEQFYQWADMLLKPLHSKEWKRARDDEDGKLGDLIYELSQMQRDLKLKIDLRLINSMRQ